MTKKYRNRPKDYASELKRLLRNKSIRKKCICFVTDMASVLEYRCEWNQYLL